AGPDRYRESLAAPGRRRVAEHHWRGRHVVGGGGAAHHPVRFRRHPRRCRAALHARHARFRRRRRGHGPARRPLRRRRTAGARDAGARPRLSGGRAGVHALAGSSRAWTADRDRVFGHLRTANRRPVALVRAPPRHRRRYRGLWQLSRRHDLAAGGAAFHRRVGLARDPYRHRLVPARQHAAARLLTAATHASASHRGRGAVGGAPASRIAVLACDVTSTIVHSRHRLLRGDVDAAGASGRLLRRPRLRRRAEMLSLMLGFGIVSRIASGFIADRIGGVRTLLLGSVLQGTALFLYLFFDGLTSLYVISALFGLFQGGIVPSYAIIVREYFSPREAGTRIGLVLMATLVGMALGGWLSGAIFDLTGSYQAAFLNGFAWNILNVSIATWLLLRSRGRRAPALA